jgi:hypothetical protein
MPQGAPGITPGLAEAVCKEMQAILEVAAWQVPAAGVAKGCLLMRTTDLVRIVYALLSPAYACCVHSLDPLCKDEVPHLPTSASIALLLCVEPLILYSISASDTDTCVTDTDTSISVARPRAALIPVSVLH